MYSGDKSGLSDPYAVVSFNDFNDKTKIIKESRCPVWNQTLMMNDIELYGNKDFIMEHIPPVTVEFWDKDMLVSSTELRVME